MCLVRSKNLISYVNIRVFNPVSPSIFRRFPNYIINSKILSSNVSTAQPTYTTAFISFLVKFTRREKRNTRKIREMKLSSSGILCRYNCNTMQTLFTTLIYNYYDKERQHSFDVDFSQEKTSKAGDPAGRCAAFRVSRRIYLGSGLAVGPAGTTASASRASRFEQQPATINITA